MLHRQHISSPLTVSKAKVSLPEALPLLLSVALLSVYVCAHVCMLV